MVSLTINIPLWNLRPWLGRLGAYFAGLGAVFFFGGCAKTYKMTVDSIADHQRTGSGYSYRIVSPGGSRMEETDLRRMEAIEYVKTALSGRGMYEALSIESADMLIEVDFGIEPPRTTFRTTSTPVHSGPNPSATGGGVRSVTVRDPRARISNFQETVQPVIVYEKYLRITASENHHTFEDNDPPAQIWSVVVTNEDESNDLRAYIPVMASAAIDYIELNSGDPREVKVKDSSPDVLFVRSGM